MILKSKSEQRLKELEFIWYFLGQEQQKFYGCFYTFYLFWRKGVN